VRAGAGLDDTAILDLGGADLWLFTCDVQCEDTHFRRPWIDAKTLGRRAAAVNLSDIAAMGGTPRAALVSLLLPPKVPVRYFDAVMQGIAERMQEFGAVVVGGNLAHSHDKIAVDVSLLGNVRRKRVVRRSGALPGDRLIVTGWPGENAAGLALLQAGASRRGALPKLFLDPEPRLQEGTLLAASGATAMIDVSDGLVTDLLHLCDASGVDVEIHLEKLPRSARLIRAARRLQVDPLTWVLQGGEAYELLCALPPSRWKKHASRLRQRLSVPLHEIGVVLPSGSGRWLVRDGERLPLVSRGFQHFSHGPGTRRGSRGRSSTRASSTRPSSRRRSS
jgi:thiamine-monophosphate kinase